MDNHKLIMSPEEFKKQCSTFRFEKSTIGQARFEQVPSPGVFQLAEGHVWNDVSQKNILTQINGQAGSVVQGINVNITPVTATNPNSAADLMTLTLPAGYANVLGKTLYVWGAGNYTTAGGQTPTFRLRILLGGVVVLSFTSTATTASVTKTWNVEGFINTSATGATGTVEAHGLFNVELGAGAAGSVAESTFNDAVVAASSAIDLTAANILKADCLFSTGNASNSIVQRQLIVQVLN